jgi:hypothetical protein
MYEIKNKASKRRITLKLGFPNKPNWKPLSITTANVARATTIKPNVILQRSRLFFAVPFEKKYVAAINTYAKVLVRSESNLNSPAGCRIPIASIASDIPKKANPTGNPR